MPKGCAGLKAIFDADERSGVAAAAAAAAQPFVLITCKQEDGLDPKARPVGGQPPPPPPNLDAIETIEAMGLLEGDGELIMEPPCTLKCKMVTV